MDLVDQQNFNNYPELSRQKHKPARIYPNLAFFSRLLEKQAGKPACFFVC